MGSGEGPTMRQKFGDGDNLKHKQFSLVTDELILNFYEAGCPFNAAVFKYFRSVRMLCIQIVIYFGFVHHVPI